MKNVTVKVITISSQLLVVTLFLTLVFSGGANNQNITIVNNNFDKMADNTNEIFVLLSVGIQDILFLFSSFYDSSYK